MTIHSLFNRLLSILLVISLLLFQSCHYYKLRTAPLEEKTSSKVIKDKPSNYVIVHLGDNFWQLDDADFSKEKVSGKLSKMEPKALAYYLQAIENDKYRVKKNDVDFIKQMHLHVDKFKKSDNLVEFNTADITKIDVMDKNVALTTISKAGTALVATTAGIGIFLLIACNCPHTYTFDGEAYHYNNTLFTGATSKNMERDDFKQLPDYNPDSEEYRLLIKNEDNELQYTNEIGLMVVNHPKGIYVVTDQKGRIYGLENQIQPTQIVDDNGEDLSLFLNENDDIGYTFDHAGKTDYKNVYATFERPSNVSHAQLILKTKNTKWSGHVYDEFSKLFGDYYTKWSKKNRKKGRDEKMEILKESGIPLVISIKRNDKWVDIETIDLIGEVNYNSLAVPIDPAYLEEDAIEIRIRSGFMFWDLDYVNIDFTAPIDLEVQHLSPTSALGSNDMDHTEALSADDELYMEHLKTGDSTTIVFKGLNPAGSSQRTIFIHSKGYYLPQNEYEGKLQLKELAKIKGEGGLSKYSQHLFNQAFINYAFNLK